MSLHYVVARRVGQAILSPPEGLFGRYWNVKGPVSTGPAVLFSVTWTVPICA